MNFSTSDWLMIISIIVAVVFGLFTILKKEKGKANKMSVEQKSGPFSKGNQKQNVNINIEDD